MTQGTLPTQSAKTAQRVFEEVLGNNLEIFDDLIGKAFSPSLDTGGIEPDAYVGNLQMDWDEAVLGFGIPADDDTFLRYRYLRHFRLFEIRIDNFGNLVWSEKRVPPRLTPEENLSLIDEVRTDMEDLYSGKARLSPSGSFEYHDAPNDATEQVGSMDHVQERAPARPSDVFGVPEEPAPRVPENKPPTRFFLEPDVPLEAPTSLPRRKALPSDVFGVPDEDVEKSVPPLENDGAPREPSWRPTRPMRPDDPFGTPGTPIFREEPVIPAPSAAASSPTPHTYSMSIRPGETKTQVIELPASRWSW